MEVINVGTRKAIKAMAVVAQTAQFVSLMPKPMDFVTRVVGDVVYLSARLNRLSVQLNKMLDSYAEIPGNYLMTQVNAITGSLSRITDRLNTYSQNAVNQTIGIGENAVDIVTELTGSAIDTTGALTTAIVGLGGAVAQTSADILGDTDTAEDIYDATEVIYEWTKDGFKKVSSDTTAPLRQAKQKLIDKRTGINTKIDETADNITDKIEDNRKWVETLITNLRNQMKALEKQLDTGFKDVTGMTSIANGATIVAEGLGKDNKYEVAATAVAGSIATVIKNFSIGKMATAFVGVITQSVLVKTGLDKLPPIDFESMLCQIRDDIVISSEDLYKQYNNMLESTYNDYVEFGEEAAKIPTEDRSYSAKNYKAFIKKFDEELKKQRDDIRLMMRNAGNERTKKQDEDVKREIRSAIKEVQKYRTQIQNAREANTLKSTIGSELNNFKKETEYRCNRIKSDWNSMMKQYKDAIAEIKEFFSNGGSCDKFIEDCCKAINKDFDDIKSLCKNLIIQLTGTGVKVVMPADIGAVVPNPIYKIMDFLLDIKTILKFIKDLLTLIIDIMNNINKLARIMINGINNLTEIIEQFMELLGLRWLMNLVQSIIDLFGEKILNARERLENSLSPVTFSETEEFNNTMEALEDLLDGDGTKLSDEGRANLADVANMLSTMGDKKEITSLIKDINSIKNKKSFGESDEKKIDEIMEGLDEQGDVVIAYKSPIIKESGENSKVSSMIDGEDITSDIKFAGWHFFHPNLDHTKKTYYSSSIMKKIKSRIIKKASKTGHKKTGGIAKLHKKTVGRLGKKRDEAYVAFYWYTYYTEDLEKDCFEFSTLDKTIIVDSVIETENGCVVEIVDQNGEKRKVFVADNMVRKGDYVNVEGVKYRVT